MEYNLFVEKVKLLKLANESGKLFEVVVKNGIKNMEMKRDKIIGKKIEIENFEFIEVS